MSTACSGDSGMSRIGLTAAAAMGSERERARTRSPMRVCHPCFLASDELSIEGGVLLTAFFLVFLGEEQPIRFVRMAGGSVSCEFFRDQNLQSTDRCSTMCAAAFAWALKRPFPETFHRV